MKKAGFAQAREPAVNHYCLQIINIEVVVTMGKENFMRGVGVDLGAT